MRDRSRLAPAAEADVSRFAAQCSHVKNKVASADKKAKEAEAKDAMVAGGKTPDMDADGTFTISTKAGGDVVCTGDWSAGAGAPLLVCLHAFKNPSNLEAFIPAAAAAGYRVMKPDLPGHGGRTGGAAVKAEGEEAMAGKEGPVAVRHIAQTAQIAQPPHASPRPRCALAAPSLTRTAPAGSVPLLS